jgi:hypothetical protein
MFAPGIITVLVVLIALPVVLVVRLGRLLAAINLGQAVSREIVAGLTL